MVIELIVVYSLSFTTLLHYIRRSSQSIIEQEEDI